MFGIFKKYIPHTAIVGVIVLVVFAVFAMSKLTVVNASQSDNLYGAAWAASNGNGMGWLAMNNCTAAGCPTGSVPFGVRIDPVTGVFSGAGWSSNFGWVDFNTNNGCPANGGQGIKIDFQKVIDTGEAEAVGFAHVYNANDDGFWDGCISMSGLTTGNTPYGVKLHSDGSLSGAAWGAEVVGWVDFSQVTSSLVFGCMDPDDEDNYNSLATIDDGSCVIPPTIPPTEDWCKNIDIWGDNQDDSEQDLIDLNATLSPQDQYTQYINQNGIAVCLQGQSDVCQNDAQHPGIQTSVPAGQIQTWIGGMSFCIPQPTTSKCPQDPVYIANPNLYTADPSLCPTNPGGATFPDFEEI